MNLPEILAPNGMIDPARILIDSPGSPHAEVTVRQWSSKYRRLELLYAGPLTLEGMRGLADGRNALEE